MDPDCPIRRHPTRSHGLARSPSYGNCGSRNLLRDHRSRRLQLTAMALSTSRSSNLRIGICLNNDTTDEGGVSPIRLRRLRLADSLTLFPQRRNHCSGSILSDDAPGIPCDRLDFRSSRPGDHSVLRRRLVLLTTKSAQNTILLVR